MNRLFKLYLTSAQEANKAFIRNLVVIPGLIACYLAFTWLMIAVAPLGLAGGFILGMAAIALLSLYYSWINRSLDQESLTFKNLLQFDSTLFFQLISVAFIFWIVLDLLLGSFTQSSGDPTIKLCVQLAAFFVFNSVPEILYQQNQEGAQALASSFEFTKEHYIEWFLPLIFFLCWPLLTIPQENLILILASSQPLIPFKLIFDAWPGFGLNIPIIGTIISMLLPIAAAHWFMLFRGRLFHKLNSGSYRTFGATL